MAQLGEFLVKNGLITPEQLDVALEVQTLYGGRLGFNLVDLGFLTSQALSMALGDFHGVETIDAKELKKISWDLIRLIPAELAVKYRALPVAQERNRLTLAMSDPTDMTAINEIGFLTGCAIRIRIAPDFVIKNALQEYYENVTFREFIRPLHAQEIQRIKEKALSRVSGADRTPATPIPALVETPAPEPPAVLADPLVVGPRIQSPPGNQTAAAQAPARDAEKPPYQKASLKFGNAQTREDIGRALVEYATAYLRRAALLTVRKERIEGWLGFGEGITPQDLRAFNVPIDSLACFRDVLASRKYHVVELGDSNPERELVRVLGGTRPRSLLLFPIIVRGKIVCVLCGDNGSNEGAVSKTLWADFAEFEKAVRKSQVAFEMIIMKWWLIQG